MFWCLSGALVSGLVGHMRGVMGLGMAVGAVLGPLFGPLVVMLLTLGGRDADPRRIIPPERLDPPGPPPS